MSDRIPPERLQEIARVVHGRLFTATAAAEALRMSPSILKVRMTERGMTPRDLLRLSFVLEDWAAQLQTVIIDIRTLVATVGIEPDAFDERVEQFLASTTK